MSEQDRMNRADRIRRMREGERIDDSPDEDPSADDGPDADDGTGDADETGEVGTDDGTPDDTAGSADEDGPDAEAEGSADGEDPETSSGTEDVADVVETIADVSAPIPSSGGMDDESTGDPEDAAEASGAESATSPAGPGIAPGAADAPADDGDAETTSPAAGLAAGVATTSREDATRVLVFSLEGERYCLDIDYIEEIVKQGTITRVPNTPEHVEGVVDMRGQITTILNPKVPIEKETTDPGEHLLVFDSEAFEEQGHLGWVVDDVRQVKPVTDEEVNESPGQADYVNGVIEDADDEEFVVWTRPDLALEDAI